MSILSKVVQVALGLLLPVGVLILARKYKIVRTISPVVICFVLGMICGTQKLFPFDVSFAITVCGLAVAVAIPLMLFSVDFIGWSRLAGTTLLSFFLCLIATLVVAAVAHVLFHPVLPDSAKFAGMLTAVYIGGTGNMNAVGVMVGVKPEQFVVLATSDMLLSLTYLTFLMTLAGPLWGRILRPFPYAEGTGPTAEDDAWEMSEHNKFPPWFEGAQSVGLAVVIVAVGALLKPYYPKSNPDAFFILVITTLAVLLSFNKKIRTLQGTQPIGMYLFLVFFFFVGVTSDLGKLFRSSLYVFLFNAVVIIGSILAHHALCFFFKIDRDTTIITSVACVFSPPFVPSVAMALRNKEILISGIATGLVGFAAANYVGAGLTWVLAHYF